MRRAVLPIFGIDVLRLRGEHVDAGIALGQRLVDGEGGDDFLVERVLDVDLAFPDRLAEIVGDLADVVAVQLAQELVAGNEPRQGALADAVERELRAGGVDADERDAAPRLAGQHEIVAGEADRGRPVLDVDGQGDGRLQRLADGGGKAGAQGDAVVAAMLEPLDAELALARLKRGRRGVVEGHEGGVVDAGLDQILGELDADARRGGVGVDGMVDDAEALAGAQVEIGGADGCVVDEEQARLVGLEGGPVHGAGLERLGHRGQDLGAGAGGARQDVAVPDGRTGVAAQRRDILAAGGGRRKIGAREARPDRPVVGRDDESGGVGLDRPARVGGGECRVGVLDQEGEAVALGGGRGRDAGAELARLVDHAGGEEVEIGGGADIRLAGECHHLAGDRAGKGVERVVVGFQETPAGAGIVGEGAAGLVAETGALALVERNVLFGAQIEAEIVAVGRGLDGARRLGERGRRQHRRQDQAKKK